jgi:hypothetical protein
MSSLTGQAETIAHAMVSIALFAIVPLWCAALLAMKSSFRK